MTAAPTTPRVARALIEAHPVAAITLFAQDNSGSPGQTRNVGIAAARAASYIVCLDADDMLDARATWQRVRRRA